MRARFDRRKLVQDYIQVTELTKTGLQHKHVVFRGPYMEQAMLSDWWQEIHRAKIVDIRVIRFNRSTSRIAAYMAKYCSKENIGRLSWSWSWVWRGFARDWTIYKRWWRKFMEIEGKTTFKNCIYGWNCILTGRLVADFKSMLAQCRFEMPFNETDFFPLHVAASAHAMSRPSGASLL